jgi:hypothetical protein
MVVGKRLAAPDTPEPPVTQKLVREKLPRNRCLPAAQVAYVCTIKGAPFSNWRERKADIELRAAASGVENDND